MSLSKVYPLTATSKDASVRQPKELIAFSRDINNEFHMDSSELQYYYLPDSALDIPGGLNLQGGFQKFNRNPKEDVGELTGLLKAIASYEKAVGKKIPVEIVTWRGLMRQLMLLPYDSRDKVVMNVVVFDGQLFIQADVPTMRASRQEEQQRQTDLGQRMQYSGYKFEAVSTLPRPWSKCTRDEIERRHANTVNNIEQYATVVRTSIGKVKMLLGAEIDCVWDYKPDRYNIQEGDDVDPLSHYVELKTSKVIDSPKQARNFERKLLRTWAQCFLVGIPRIIYGFRDDNLIMRSIEEFQTEKIPILLRDQQQQQNQGQKPVNKAMKSLKFFSGLLNWINDTIPKDDESKTYRIEYDPVNNKNYLNLTENPQDVTDKLLGPFNDADGGMLTDEFKEWRKQLATHAN